MVLEGLMPIVLLAPDQIPVPGLRVEHGNLMQIQFHKLFAWMMARKYPTHLKTVIRNLRLNSIIRELVSQEAEFKKWVETGSLCLLTESATPQRFDLMGYGHRDRNEYRASKFPAQSISFQGSEKCLFALLK